MRSSQIAAKVVVRLFFFLILLALVPLFTGGQIDKQLHNTYIMTNNKLALISPILLMLGFIALLVICTIQKYAKPDINWLLVLNTVILIIYGITVYVRISHLIG
jgi:hypothetical protein